MKQPRLGWQYPPPLPVTRTESPTTTRRKKRFRRKLRRQFLAIRSVTAITLASFLLGNSLELLLSFYYLLEISLLPSPPLKIEQARLSSPPRTVVPPWLVPSKYHYGGLFATRVFVPAAALARSFLRSLSRIRILSTRIYSRSSLPAVKVPSVPPASAKFVRHVQLTGTVVSHCE